MTYLSTIKNGFHTVNKNWQLIFVQIVSLVLSGISFFIIVGMPIAIAFIMFGLDLTEILRLKDIVSALKGSAELLNKYFAMALIVILSLLLYLTFIIMLWVFAFGGTVGILAKSIREEINRFSLKTFFSEGRQLFLPISAFSAIIGVIFLVIAFLLGIMVGGASTIIETAKGYEATFGLFIGVFFSLVLISVGMSLLLITLSVAAFGIASLAFNRSGSVNTLKETARYLYSSPSAIGFYGILLLGYMVTGFVVIFIGTPLTFIPILGPIISL
ncbi:MAG: hypothetical protein HY099_05990, partial [Nitrospirae bacterium]|nr:hypothetical protein [Nitrospirota bacterium]